MLSDNFISAHSLQRTECAQLIGRTVCSVKLDVSPDVHADFDEALLLKYLHLIHALLSSAHCLSQLSASIIWHILAQCRYVYFNIDADKYSTALIEFAELAITHCIRVVSRTFKTHRANLKKHRSRSKNRMSAVGKTIDVAVINH